MRSQNIINFLLLASILIFAGLSLSLLGPFYPSHALTKGVSITQSGLVFASVFAAAVIATPICGQYVHLGGPKIFFINGAFIIGFGNIAFGLLDETNDTFIFLGFSFAIRIFIAFGEGAILASAYTLAAQQASKKHEGKLIAIAEACFGIGTMFGPSVGGILYQLGGFPLPFILCGGLILIFMVASIFLIKDSREGDYELLEEDERHVSWKELFSTPGIPISMFALTFAGTAWSWYSGTLEPFLEIKFNVNSSEIGLIFMTFSVGYTLFTPIFGILMDKGLNGLHTLLIGNLIITISYLFIGPSPLFNFLGQHLWVTTVANGINGMGCAATYLGSLVYMVKSAEASDLPNNDQTKGMVSSLWVVSYSAGGYLGSTFGGLSYDQLGFENGTLIIMFAMAFSVLVLVTYMSWISCRNKQLLLPVYLDPELSYQNATEKTALISDLSPDSPPRTRRYLTVYATILCGKGKLKLLLLKIYMFLYRIMQYRIEYDCIYYEILSSEL